MDLIYADEKREEIGVLMDSSFDLAFGSDENDFTVTVSINNNICSKGYWIYVEGTEYGGIVDDQKVDTEQKKIVYHGRTFHGILEKKIIEPDAGEDYLIVSGDVNTLIGNIISRIGLNDIFEIDAEKASGLMVNKYQFERYIDAYKGICSMVAAAGGKLHIEWHNGKAVMAAVPVEDYTDDEIDSDHVAFVIKKHFITTNHLICLGKGNLKERQILHLYLDEKGEIAKTQYFFGLQELTETFDYPNAESLEELERYGKRRLLELNEKDDMQLKLNDTYAFDVGDVITASEVITGISLTRVIKKKIVTINKGILKIEYKVGEK